MYERHASGEAPAAADMARFTDYAARYEARKGAQILIVRSWRKALGAR
jgi:hypothetical protein